MTASDTVDPFEGMTAEQFQQLSEEMDARWREALKTAPAATVRGYYHTLRKIQRSVFLYGVMGVSQSLGVAPQDVVAILDDDSFVNDIAKSRDISLEGCDSITAEEQQSYQQSYIAVYSDFIESGLLPAPRNQVISRNGRTSGLDA